MRFLYDKEQNETLEFISQEIRELRLKDPFLYQDEWPLVPTSFL